jgi:uncharacterized protein (TIGR02265 family)
MRRAKGSVLIDFVKTIKADKTGAYDKVLTPEDKAFLDQRILPSAWYDYEIFKRCFNAVFEVFAQKNLETIRKVGKMYGESIMTNQYKNLLKNGDPLEYIKKYPVYIKNFFDFGEVQIIEEGPKQVLLRILDLDPTFPPVYYIMIGWLERTLELCGARSVRIEFIKKSWENNAETEVRYTWD